MSQLKEISGDFKLGPTSINLQGLIFRVIKISWLHLFSYLLYKTQTIFNTNFESDQFNKMCQEAVTGQSGKVCRA